MNDFLGHPTVMKLHDGLKTMMINFLGDIAKLEIELVMF